MARTPGFKITRTTNDMLAEGRKPKIEPETGWWKVGSSDYPGVGFTNTYDNAGIVAGITNPDAAWYLSEDGETRLRGTIGGGIIGEAAFVLPEEVRPEYSEDFIVSVDDEGNIDLSGIRFRAYQRGDVDG